MNSKSQNGPGSWADRSPRERLCVALDVSDRAAALDLVQLLAEHVGWFKVGSELFSSEGPAVIKEIKDTGAKVFLDLKYHDIPNTVARAVSSCRALNIDMINVHAMGGRRMMEAAAEAANGDGSGTRPYVIAVTLLTSMDQQGLTYELRVATWVRAYVTHLTRMVLNAGLDGVVSSPQEAARIRLEFGDEPVIVTPGIRPAGAEQGDQRRTRTTGDAVRDGASMIVIGRPIVESDDPQAAAKRIAEELDQAMQHDSPE